MSWDEYVAWNLSVYMPVYAIASIRAAWHGLASRGQKPPCTEEELEERLHAIAEFYDLCREVEQ